MNYPKGSIKRSQSVQSPKASPKSPKQYGNRGMTLEKEIVESNSYYLESGKAVIHKKPTPIQVVQVDYPKRSAAVIKEAYYQRPSTTDFNGVYNGLYIDFEAKETKNKNSLPFSNIHEHQVNHMLQVEQQGGISFFIIRFTSRNETFLLPIRPFIEVWNQQFDGKRKSLSYTFIKESGYLIPFTFQAKVNYIDVIDRVYITGGDHDESK
ncbi:Holliday junction resolvase RecU [Halalkalibacillus sediminis]|uniref:Holliday junction resolvase RecU n=1 Tax=Halalkalibacillus sediminis TaxID=2018042 RepID=A0A2I0QWY4_9BACI|nr:Holliday junction resolvase RecU [Halalkalibacillus sediminis]PKR78818.1 Holliday junction resolvase RecU [Halalkalibacillus sediminis]